MNQTLCHFLITPYLQIQRVHKQLYNKHMRHVYTWTVPDVYFLTYTDLVFQSPLQNGETQLFCLQIFLYTDESEIARKSLGITLKNTQERKKNLNETIKHLQ